MIRHSDHLLTAWLAALLLWAPLAFGGVTPWAVASVEVLSFGALALAAAALARAADLRPVALPAAAVAAIALLGALQALPWPPSLAALLSPALADAYARAAALPGVGAAPPHLTLAPAATRSAALLWAAAAACLIAGAVAGAGGRGRAHRRWLAAAVVAGALFQVFFGAREWFTRASTLWGVEIPRSPRLHGTFVNPNHLALYFEIALPIAFAWGWWAVRHVRMQPRIEVRMLMVVLPGFVWLTLFLGLAFTASRGGLLGAVAGVVAQGALAAGARGRWRSALAGLLAAMGGLGLVALVALREGLGRIAATSAADVSWGARVAEYRAVLALWRRFPLTGAGLGAFRDAFPAVQPATLQGTWWHAHSDLLELLATTGLVGALALAAGLAPLLRRLLAQLAREGRSEDRGAPLAVLGALIALLCHEALDFGLSMPGNALTLAVLAGAAAGTEVARRRSPASRNAERASAQADVAGQDAAAADALEVEDVEPRPGEREREREPAARVRRKSPQQGPVER